MKKHTFIHRALAVMSFSFLLLLACNKEGFLQPNDTDGWEDEEELATPFKVLGYTVADAVDLDGNPKKRVTFQMEGEADVIDLYSGDEGSNFEYRDGRVQKVTALNLSFQAQYDEGDQKQPESFAVLASTDFNGGTLPADVEAATWTDLTHKYTFASTGSNWVEAGNLSADISEVIEEGKPLYLALRYTARDQRPAPTGYGSYSIFRVRNWLVTSQIEGGSPQIVRSGHWDPEDVRFYPIEIGLWRAGRTTFRAQDLTFRGNHGSDSSHPNEFRATTIAWGISPPIMLESVISDPALPVVVKTREDDQVETFSVDYTGPGEYRAVFLVSKGGAMRIVQTDVVIPE